MQKILVGCHRCYQAPPDSPSDAREALRRAAVEAAKVEKGADLFAGSIFFELACIFQENIC